MDLITTAQLLGNFGEFVGAIAVVVTLGYLVVQIKQNTKATKSASAETSIDVLSVRKQKFMVFVPELAAFRT